MKEEAKIDHLNTEATTVMEDPMDAVMVGDMVVHTTEEDMVVTTVVWV